ncbi:MAG: hypothetical protein GVX96_04355, partial [Bacteroidetes bacterium]|nr:hypothetical protein [Bacteroidota bacterium]
KIDSNNQTLDTFTLRPNIIYNSDFTKVEAYNPDTRRRWNYDVFTHLSGLPPQEMNFEEAKNIEDSLSYSEISIPLNDTTIYEGYKVHAKLDQTIPSHDEYQYQKGDLTLGLSLTVWGGKFAKPETKTPFLLVRDNALFQFSAYFPNTRLKFKLPESFADTMLEEASNESSETIELQIGDSLRWENYDLGFLDVKQPPSNSNYESKEGDLAIGAVIRVTDVESKRSFGLEPVFFIRDNEVYYTADRDSVSGMEIRLGKVDPEKSSFTFRLSSNTFTTPQQVPVKVASEVPRSDYIVLSAIKFPGINLFWLGSLMLLFGFFTSMIMRWKNKV